jgi:hypothetical protein
MSAKFFEKKVPLYVRLHEMSSYFFPHCSQTILICPQHMSPFGCSSAAVVAQPGMGTASLAAAVLRQYGHF